MADYPIILKPSRINSLLQAEPKISLPLAPVLKLPEPPKSPGPKPKKIEWNKKIFDLVAVGGLGLLFAWLTNSFGAGALAIFIVFLTSFLVQKMALRYAMSQVKSYQNRIEGWEEYRHQYSILLQEYEQKRNCIKNEYKNSLLKHEEECDRIKAETFSPENLKTYRNSLIRKELKQTIPHDGQDSEAPKGWSEHILKSFLIEHFPNEIHANLMLSIPDYPHPYSPDITYINKTINLYIDIEIDEPYAFKGKKLCHFLGKDDRRNDFFLERGWLVIRFCEEQVVRHTASCCKVVAQAIAEMTGDEEIMHKFKDIPDLALTPQWTEKESQVMANENYRDTYIERKPRYRID